jgi:hypothetical protein
MTLIHIDARRGIALLGLMIGLVSPVGAVDRPGTERNGGSGSPPSRPTNSLPRVNEILDRWEPVAVIAGQHSTAWHELFATQLMAMDAWVLDGVARVKPLEEEGATASYGRFIQAVRSAEMQSYMLSQSGKGHMKLASTTNDQVFAPVVPCRIVDTRNTGGAIAAGTTRNFYFYATNGSFDWHTQGGLGQASVTCPDTVNPNGGPPSAAVITVTVVSPTAATNFVLWGGPNAIPTASALNWSAGEVLANTTVIPAGGRSGTGPGGSIEDFAVAYNGPSGSAHFVADVVGYLVENRATALDCFETGLTSTSIASNSQGTAVTPACPAGYALTGGRCNGSYAVAVWPVAEYYVGTFPQAQWYCRFINLDTLSGAHGASASARCCRVPGR